MANNATQETSYDGQDYLRFTPRGFALETLNTAVSANGGTYIFMAIRRPHKPALTADDFFQQRLRTGDGTNKYVEGNFPVDFGLTRRNAGGPWWSNTRSMGEAANYLDFTSTSATDTSNSIQISNATDNGMLYYSNININGNGSSYLDFSGNVHLVCLISSNIEETEQIG